MRKIDVLRQSPFASAVACFRLNLSFSLSLAATVILVEHLTHFLGAGGSFFLPVFISAWLSAIGHLTFLYPERSPEKSQDPQFMRLVFRMLWRLLALSVTLYLAFIINFAVLSVGIGSVEAGAVLSAVAVLALFGVLMALFGTLLPDLTLGGSGNLREAYRRGRSALGRTFWDLLRYPVAVWIVGLIGFNIMINTSFPETIYDPRTGEIHWLAIVPELAFAACGVLSAYAAAAVLSRAFLRAEGEQGSHPPPGQSSLS